MASIPPPSARQTPLFTGGAARELVAHGRRFWAGEITAAQWHDLTHNTLMRYQGTLAAGRIGERRASGSPAVRAE